MASNPGMHGSEPNFSEILDNAKFVILDHTLLVAKDNSYPEIDSRNCTWSFGQNQDCNLFDEDYTYDNGKDDEIESGLTYLKMLCDEHIPDSPEFIDVNKLSQYQNENDIEQTDTIAVSDAENEDDDDDVIFVGEYHTDHGDIRKGERKDLRREDSEEGNKVRRNPVRSARSKARDFTKDLIFEDELGFLDSSTDEENHATTEDVGEVATPAVLKEWPINAHERPVYNTVTMKVDALDYKIPEKKENVVKRKPKIPIGRKPKKKYVPGVRRRRNAVEKPCFLQDLQPLVNETTEMLSEFFIRVKESRKLIGQDFLKCTDADRTEALKNQTILYSVVNGGKQFDFKHFASNSKGDPGS